MIGLALLRGAALGLAIAAPVGPIGLLCIRQSMTAGWRAGLSCGLGAATADGLYACVGSSVYSLLARLLLREQAWLTGAAGCFLLYPAIRMGLSSCHDQPPRKPARAHLSNYASTLALTLTLTLSNPITMLSFAALFAAGGTSGSAYAMPAAMAGGVVLGSTLWWCCLSLAAATASRHLRRAVLQAVGRLSALLLAVMALRMLTAALRSS